MDDKTLLQRLREIKERKESSTPRDILTGLTKGGDEDVAKTAFALLDEAEKTVKGG